MPRPDKPIRNKDDWEYPAQVYISYTQSIALAVERQIMDNKPSRPLIYWKIWEEEILRAKIRFRQCSVPLLKAARGKNK